ncbi:MAG: ATP-dependent helicase [Candidatus Thermoplasmatota archaeon]|nr:ATP-dependent helicase [Candidatus Thermoplasmatota archaeon]
MEKAETKQFRVEKYLPFLDHVIAEWFNLNYTEITEPQEKAIPLIHQKRNVLVSSPTGTGKTLTGFLSVINELLGLARAGQLEDKIYCVYISPLKALANDIDRNLKKPLDGIYDLLKEDGEDLKRITVGVRSGDTSQNERQRMLKKPPNILITTPESLSLALSAPKFREKFGTVRWVIVDEIHEISSTKRGSLLSANLERLRVLSGNFIRVGLSATQAPLSVIGKYLCGYEDGQERPFEIVDVDTKRFLDLQTITPVRDLTQVSAEVANNLMYDILAKYIADHRTTLVFTNTRSSTEHVAIRLKARGVESIEAHHSSLGKETRHEVEGKLKAGELKCVITSTSLELGIDIGFIDLVLQIGSPKSVSKGLQRIGRSGHAIHELAKGRFLVFDLDDLMECTVLTRAAYDRDIDRVRVPENPLDVLSQVIVGMSLEKAWDVDEALKLLQGSYTFHNLSAEDFDATLEYLSGDMEAGGIYPKIWFDKQERRFGKKKSSRMIYFMNTGTIPDESDFQVVNERGRHLGQLSEKFAERLKTGDVFVLGARTYLFLRSSRNRILVREATGMRPTVPSWTGEMLPRSHDLGVLIGRFRQELASRIGRGEDARQWLMDNYMLDDSGSDSLVSYVTNQSRFFIPTDSKLYVEGYKDESGSFNIIFHVPLGRRVNDALSRAYAQAVSNKYNQNLRITITDDGFMITSASKIPVKEIIPLINESNFLETVRRSIWNTEIFKQRFRHCAARALMVLRKYKGYDITVAKQQLRSDKVLRYLESFRNFPILKETFREIMEDMMDVPSAERYVRDVIGKGSYVTRDYSPDPSPFSHGIILAGVSDIVLMEDRAKLLRQLQSKILEKVYGSEAVRFLIQDPRTVEMYFASKVPRIKDPESYQEFLRYFLYVDPFKNKFNSPFPYADVPVTDITEELIDEDKLVSVFVRGTQWTHIDNYSLCRSIFSSSRDADPLDLDVQKLCDGKTFVELKEISGLEENDLRNSLIRLESSYKIRKKMRSGTATYCPVGIPFHEVSEGIRKGVLSTISSYGPLTTDEILIKVPANSDEISSALSSLVREGVLLLDFVTPVYSKQYIQKSDLDALLSTSTMDLLEERSKSIMKPVKDAAEFFDRYGFAYNVWNILCRGPAVTSQSVDALIQSGSVVRCRAIKRREYMVARWLLDCIYSIRYDPLSAEGKEVLNLVLSGHTTESEISTRSGLERRIVRQILSILEYHLLLKKGGNGYEPFMEGAPQIAREEAIRKLVKAYGPVSKRELSHYFWADISSVPEDVKSTYYRGEVYYGELQDDVKTGPSLVNLWDPIGIYLERNYSGLSTVNGLLMESGKELADFSMEIRNGVCWIDGLEGSISNQGPLKGALDAMVSTRYVTAAIAASTESAAVGTVVSGSIPLDGTPEDDFILQSLARYLTPLTVDQPFISLKNSRLGFRTESEVERTGINQREYDTYLRSRLTFNFMGPFQNLSTASMDTISLYRDLRSARVTDEEESILEYLEENPYSTEQEIRGAIRGVGIGLRSHLVDLFSSALVARDYSRKYLAVPRGKGKSETLVLLFLYLLDRFGFVNESRIKEAFGSLSREEIEESMRNILSMGKTNQVLSPSMRSVLYLSPHKKVKISGGTIVFPREAFILYNREYFKRRYGTSNIFLLVENGRIVCGFRAKKRGRILTVTKIDGERSNRELIRRTLNEMNYAVSFS